MPALAHTWQGGRAGKGFREGLGIPGAQTGGFSCFGMAGCMGKEEGMRIRIPEQDKRSEHQVGPSPGRAENPINAD